MKRTYIKKGIWHLGGKKKTQKGGFLPQIARLIARPILTSIAGSLGTKLLGTVAKNFFGGRKRRKYRRKSRRLQYV